MLASFIRHGTNSDLDETILIPPSDERLGAGRRHDFHGKSLSRHFFQSLQAKNRLQNIPLSSFRDFNFEETFVGPIGQMF